MAEFGPKPAGNWKVGTFFSGVMEAYKVTKNPEFFEISKKWCEDANWTVNHIYHADDVCKAQTFLEVYFVTGDKDVLAQIDANLSPILAREPVSQKKVGGAARQRKGMLEWTGRNIWSWCDALYMQPPVMAQLAKATGNQDYLDLMDEMYWDAHEFLYSPKHQLFFRDEKFFPDVRKTPKGQPVFWGRGNGWVIGGLVRTIDYIPEDDPRREKYISLFQNLMASIVCYQQEDGLWRSSLNEPSWHDTKETSSSSFFTYGLFAGINRGWLCFVRHGSAMMDACARDSRRATIMPGAIVVIPSVMTKRENSTSARSVSGRCSLRCRVMISMAQPEYSGLRRGGSRTITVVSSAQLRGGAPSLRSVKRVVS